MHKITDARAIAVIGVVAMAGLLGGADCPLWMAPALQA